MHPGAHPVRACSWTCSTHKISYSIKELHCHFAGSIGDRGTSVEEDEGGEVINGLRIDLACRDTGVSQT